MRSLLFDGCRAFFSRTFSFASLNLYGLIYCVALLQLTVMALPVHAQEKVALSGPAAASGAFTISWPHPQNSGANTYIKDYTLYRTRGAPYGNPAATNQVSYYLGSTNSFNQPALPAGEYYFVVTYSVSVLIPNPPGGGGIFLIPSQALATVVLPIATPPVTPASSNTGSYAVTWPAAATAVTYRLEQRINGGAWTNVIDAKVFTYTVSGAASGIYEYRLRGCNPSGCGAFSAVSTTVVTLPPSTPTLSAPANDASGSYTVSADNDITATRYEFDLSVNGGAFAMVQNSASPTYSPSAFASGAYSVRARACSDAGCSGNSDPVTTIVLLPPSIPILTTPPTTSATGTYSITWSASATATSYQVDQSYNFGPYTTIFSGNGLATSLFGMGTGFYQYVVRACNASGCSASSSPQGVSVLLPPSAPAAPVVPTHNGTGTFAVTWASGGDSYELDQRFNGGAWSLAYSGNAQSFSATGLTSGVYEYRLRACNGSGCSSSSPTVATSVNLSPAGLSGPAVDVTGAYTLSWDAVVGATSYVLQERFNTGAWSTIYSGAGLAASVSGRSAGTYNYRVQSCTAAGCSAFVDPITTIVAVPSVPEGLATSGNVDSGNYTISWSASDLADHYELQDSLNGVAWATIYTGATTSLTLSSVRGTLDFQVRACNAVGCSGYSTSVNIVVDSIPLSPGSQLPAGVPSVADATIKASDQIGSTEGNFRVDESGAATYTIPLFSVSGTAGVQPKFSLDYSSQGGNGLLGQGWSLSGLSSIGRCRQTLLQDGAAKPITWTNADRFCMDGERLIFLAAENPGKVYGDPGTVYHTEIESYSTITAVGGSAGNPDYFTVTRKDGSLSYYGNVPGGSGTDAKVVNPNNGRALTWSLKQFQDSVGNPIWYLYTNDNAGQRISEVRYAYGANAGPGGYGARLLFNYDLNRKDTASNYLAGMVINLAARLINVTSEHGGVAVRAYNLVYEDREDFTIGSNNVAVNLSRLMRVQECVGALCLPATSFTWTNTGNQIGWSGTVTTILGASARSSKIVDLQPGDINGDGCTDLVWTEKTSSQNILRALFYAVSDCAGGFNLGFFQDGSLAYSFAPAPYGASISVADYNADGRADVLFSYGGGPWQVFLSTPQADGSWRINTSNPIATGVPFGARYFSDLNSDGLVDNFVASEYRLATHDVNEPLSSSHYYKFGSVQNTNTAVMVLDKADLNGDGINDILYSNRNCPSGPPGTTIPCTVSYSLQLFNGAGIATDAGSFQVEGIAYAKLVDLNSDGLADIVYAKADVGGRRWYFQLNTGAGMGPSAEVGLTTGITYPPTDQPPMDIVDYNLDGHLDLLFYDSATSTVRVALWNPLTKAFAAALPLFGFNNYTLINPERHWFMDANGDGAPDYITVNSAAGDSVTVSLARGVNQPRRTITRITNGLGAKTDITYGSLITSNHYDHLRVGTTAGIRPVATPTLRYFFGVAGANISGTYSGTTYQQSYSKSNAAEFYTSLNGIGDLPPGSQTLPKDPNMPVLEWIAPVYVVIDVRGSAPATADSTTALGSVDNSARSWISYYYAEARIQAGGRGLLGFHRVVTVDKQASPEIITSTIYRQDYPFIGSPQSTQVYLLDTSTSPATPVLLRRSDSNWGFQNYDATTKAHTLPPYRPVLLASVEQSYEALKPDRSLLGYVSTTYSYDAYGNTLTTKVDTYNGSRSLLASKLATNQFGATVAEQRLGRLAQTVVTNTRPGVTAQAADTRTSAFGYYCFGDAPCDSAQKLRGLLYQEIIEPNQSAFKLTTTYEYDAFGNRAKASVSGWDIPVRYTRWEYDDLGRFRNKTYNSLEQKIEDVISRNNLGQPLQVNGLNGAVKQFAYGPFGRQYLEYSNTGTYSVNLRYASLSGCPSGTVLAETVVRSGGAASSVCYDILVRPIREISAGFDGSAIYADKEYDSHGRLKHNSIPYFAGAYSSPGAIPATTLTYDLFNRVTQTRYPDGTTSTTSYSGLETSGTDARGFSRTELRNALGELERVTDHLGGQVQYAYFANGALRSTTSTATAGAGAYGNVAAASGAPSSIVTSFSYDAIGRKQSMSDPDKGEWSYEYYASGELKSQADAKGQVTAFQYDELTRITNRTDTCSGASHGCAAGTVQSDVFWVYDNPEGGIGQLDYLIDGVTGYIRVMRYDEFGRVSQTGVFFGEGSDYYQRVSYDQYNRVLRQYDAAGPLSGVENVYNSYGYLAQVLDTGPGQQSFYTVQSMDAGGRVTAEINGAATTTRSYDTLTGRLAAINSSVAGLNGVQNLEYHYDAVGNMDWRRDNAKSLTENFSYDELNRLVRDQVGANTAIVTYDSYGNIVTKSGLTYTYGGAGPHAATNVGGVAYTFDANGNNTAGDGRTIAYSVFDKPLSISKGSFSTQFMYDSDRALGKRTDNNAGQVTTTVTVGNVEHVIRPDGSFEMRRYIAGALVTAKYNRGGIWQGQTNQYLLKDHLGSIDVIIDQNGSVVSGTGNTQRQAMSFDPWGLRRDTTTWAPLTISLLAAFDHSITNKGFTGHEMVDEVGIIHMNGRIYDPRLGRFLQADPTIQFPDNTQSYNRYSYALNNPMIYIDPSGYGLFSFLESALNAILDAVPALVNAGFTVIAFAACGGFAGNVPGGAACAGAMSTALTKAQGGTWNQALKAGAITAASAFAFGSWGGPGADNIFEFSDFLANGTIGGITNLLSGDNFGNGFLAAGVGAWLGFKAGGKWGGVGRIMTAAAVGGVVSEVTGGKFVNGAVTAAFAAAMGEGLRQDGGASVGDDPDRSLSRMKNHITVTSDGDKTLIKINLTVSYDVTVTEEQAKAYANSIIRNWTKSATYEGHLYSVSTEITVVGRPGLFTSQGDVHITSCGIDCNWVKGKSDPGRGIIYRGSNGAPNTPAHEFGHIMGLGDRELGPPSIMRAYTSDRTVTGYDIKRVSGLYGQ